MWEGPHTNKDLKSRSLLTRLLAIQLESTSEPRKSNHNNLNPKPQSLSVANLLTVGSKSLYRPRLVLLSVSVHKGEAVALGFRALRPRRRPNPPSSAARFAGRRLSRGPSIVGFLLRVVTKFYSRAPFKGTA